MTAAGVTRRRALQAAGSALLAALAGCNTTADNGSDATATPAPVPTDTPTPSPTAAFDPSDHVDDWQDDRMRGTAEPIETEERDDSAPPVVELTCAEVARDAVEAVVLNQLDQTEGLTFLLSRVPEEEKRIILAIRAMIVERESSMVVVKPEVSFTKFREVTPREVRGTIVYNDSEFTCEHEVYVEDRVFYVQSGD